MFSVFDKVVFTKEWTMKVLGNDRSVMLEGDLALTCAGLYHLLYSKDGW